MIEAGRKKKKSTEKCCVFKIKMVGIFLVGFMIALVYILYLLKTEKKWILNKKMMAIFFAGVLIVFIKVQLNFVWFFLHFFFVKKFSTNDVRLNHTSNKMAEFYFTLYYILHDVRHLFFAFDSCALSYAHLSYTSTMNRYTDRYSHKCTHIQRPYVY